MNESTRQSHLEQFSSIFSRLTSQDVEQFYADYQRWSLYQEIAAAQQNLAALHEQLAENAAQIELVRPSAIALATLARLQASGVEDIDLLGRMLARGENWLDRTIQHLEYFEQQGVIRDDYEEWCRHALEDAFDWLDTLQSAAGETTPAAPAALAALETTPPSPTSEDDAQPSSDTNEATEELLLQKLMSEDIESRAPEETTLKIATIQPFTETIPNDVGAQFIASAAGPDGNDSHNQPSTDATPTGAITSADNDVGAQFIPSLPSLSPGQPPSEPPVTEPSDQALPVNNQEGIAGAQFTVPVTEPSDQAFSTDNDEDIADTQLTTPVAETIGDTLPADNDEETVDTQSTAPLAAIDGQVLPTDNDGETVDAQSTAPLTVINKALPADNDQEPFISPVATTDGQASPTDNHQEIVGAQFRAPVVGLGGETREQDPTDTEPKTQEETAPRRPHFLRRLLLALWR